MDSTKTLRIFNHLLTVAVQKIPEAYSTGITNETEDFQFLPFIDIDNVYREKVDRFINFISKEFALSACILLTSSEEQKDEEGRMFGNYHLIFLDKMRYFDCLRIVSFAPVNPQVRLVPHFYKYKSWVLRITEKHDSAGNTIMSRPELVKVKDFGNRANICSKAHYKFFRNHYDIPKLNLVFDSSSKVFLIDYNTHGVKATET